MFKKLLIFVFVLVSSLFFTSCISANFTYIPSSIIDIENEKIVRGSYEENWEKIINNVTDDVFVINNLSKDSGFINISFSSSPPSRYVNCGEFEGYYRRQTLFGKIDEVYSGFVSDSSSVILYDYNGASYRSNVTTSLSGRINLLLINLGNKKQNYKVNIKYILRIQAKTYNLADPNRIPDLKDYNIDFNSKQSSRAQGGTESQLECASNGYLENQFLNYIQ